MLRNLDESVRRNVIGLMCAILFILASSAALYNRAWEVFEPAEPAHGPAIFSVANPPTLHNTGYDLMQVRLPDGRIWFDDLGYSEPQGLKRLWKALVSPLPVSIGPQQFMAGSNWVSATARRVDFISSGESKVRSSRYSPVDTHVVGYLDTIGVRSDGTLWISNPNEGKWTGNDMTRFGDGTNWRQVVRSYAGVLLLKDDGTVWSWGKNRLDWSDWWHNWPSLQTDRLNQIGTDSDWKELFTPNWNCFARKSDDSVWAVRWSGENHSVEMQLETNLNQVSFQTLSVANEDMAYVSRDGTLWARWQHQRAGTNVESYFVRVGAETNWIAVALTGNNMVALKSDGSLWQWLAYYYQGLKMRVQKPPTRLGIHNDWVAIAGNWEATIALAADGSLWLWPNRQPYSYYAQQTLLKLPKQPQFLGNVFGKGE